MGEVEEDVKEGDKSSLLPAPSHPSIGVTLRDGLETCRLLFLLRYTNFDSGVRSSSSPQTAAEHVKFERVIRITNLCAAITVRPRSLPNGVPVVLDRLSRIAVLQSRFHTPIVESPDHDALLSAPSTSLGERDFGGSSRSKLRSQLL